MERPRPHRTESFVGLPAAIPRRDSRSSLLSWLAILCGCRADAQDFHCLLARCRPVHAVSHWGDGVQRHSISRAILVRNSRPNRTSVIRRCNSLLDCYREKFPLPYLVANSCQWDLSLQQATLARGGSPCSCGCLDFFPHVRRG